MSCQIEVHASSCGQLGFQCWGVHHTFMQCPPTLADRPLFSQPLQHASSQKLRQATKKQLPRVIDCTRHEANAKGLAEYSVFLDEDTEES
jgi:hypothetical protein